MEVPNNDIIFNSAVVIIVVVISVLVVAYLRASAPLLSLQQGVVVAIMIGTLGLMILGVILVNLMILHERIKRLL